LARVEKLLCFPADILHLPVLYELHSKNTNACEYYIKTYENSQIFNVKFSELSYAGWAYISGEMLMYAKVTQYISK
jgi:hypothetical protein